MEANVGNLATCKHDAQGLLVLFLGVFECVDAFCDSGCHAVHAYCCAVRVSKSYSAPRGSPVTEILLVKRVLNSLAAPRQ